MDEIMDSKVYIGILRALRSGALRMIICFYAQFTKHWLVYNVKKKFCRLT